MTDYIDINGGTLIHLSMVKRIRDITPEDRKWLSEQGPHVNAEEFNTRIEQANGAKPFARETVNQFSAQGVALVETEEGAFIPRLNIKHTKDITDADRKSFEERTGNKMRAEFKSQVETTTGKVLATVDSPTIMRRMSQAERLDLSRAAPAQSTSKQSLPEQRDAVMKQAVPKPAQGAPSNGRTQAPQQ